MKLIKCNISAFGIFNNEEFVFDDGLSCVVEENGFGKTTLAMFIKAMFYSLETARKGATAKTSERVKYYPYSGGNFGGSLTFSLGQKEYRVTRFFDKLSKTNDTFELTDLEKGLKSLDFSENLGEEIFGIDEEGFLRSTFSNGRADLSALPGSLRSKIGSNVDSLDDMGEYEKADGKLSDAIKLISGKNGKIECSKKKISQNKEDILRLKVDISESKKISLEIKGLEKELSDLNEKSFELDEKFKKASSAELNRRKLDDYNKLLNEARLLERDISALEQKYNGEIPGKQKISELDEKISEYLSDKNLLNHQKTKQQNADFISVFNAFKDNFPTDEEIKDISDNLKKINSLKSAILISKERTQKISEELKEYSQAPEQKKETKYMYPVSAKITICLAALFVLIGIAVCFFSVIIGAAVLTISAIVLVAALLMAEVNRKLTNSSKLSDTEKVRANIQYSNELEIERKKIQNNTDEIQKLEQKCKEFLGGFSIYENKDIENEFEKIRLYRSRYLNEIVPSIEESKNLQNKLKKVEEEIISEFKFLSVSFKTEENFADKIKEISADILKLENIKDELSKVKKETEEKFKRDDIENISLTENESLTEDISKEKKENEQNKNDIQKKIAILREQNKTLGECEQQLYELENENQSLEEEVNTFSERLNVLKSTREMLSAAKTRLTRKYAAKVIDSFEKYSGMFLSRAPKSLTLNSELELSVLENGIEHLPQSFSNGQQSVMDVCLRLSLIDAMFQKEMPFMILDDPFSELDEENLCKAAELIKSVCKDRQIIYLTCHNSRKIV